MPKPGRPTGSRSIRKARAKLGFDLQLQGPPANDAFSGAQALGPSLPAYAIGSTKLATEQSGEPDHAGKPGGHSVWFTWTASGSGPVVVTACPYTERAVAALAVYTGSSLGSLTPVASDAAGGSSCRASAAEAELDAVAGTTYRIAIDGEGEGLGVMSLEIQGRPANDDFASPQVLAAVPMSAGGSNRLATKQAGEPNHAGDAGGHSLWFSWTPASSGPVVITACGHTREIDPLLAVYTGAAVGGLTPVAADDDAPGPPANELCEFPRGNSEVSSTRSPAPPTGSLSTAKVAARQLRLGFERGRRTTTSPPRSSTALGFLPTEAP